MTLGDWRKAQRKLSYDRDAGYSKTRCFQHSERSFIAQPGVAGLLHIFELFFHFWYKLVTNFEGEF